MALKNSSPLSSRFNFDGTVARNISSKGKTTIDIVNEYAWTLSPQSAREDVPFAILEEYQQTTAQLLASMAYYFKQGTSTLDTIKQDTANAVSAVTGASNPGAAAITEAFKLMTSNAFGKSAYADPYKYRYFGEKTGISYKIPYFSDVKYSRKTTFVGDNSLNQTSGIFDSLIGGMGSKVVQGIRDVLTPLTPGQVGLMEVQTWKQTSDESYSFTFDLINTGTLEDIAKNREFCFLFTYQNSPSKRNFFITDPPVIYDMYIPDIVHMPACHVNDINITNLGNTRLIDGIPIPEAYRITFSMKSLFYPTRNIMQGTVGDNKLVQAIGESSVINAAVQGYINKLTDNALTTGAAKAGMSLYDVTAQTAYDTTMGNTSMQKGISQSAFDFTTQKENLKNSVAQKYNSATGAISQKAFDTNMAIYNYLGKGNDPRQSPARSGTPMPKSSGGSFPNLNTSQPINKTT